MYSRDGLQPRKRPRYGPVSHRPRPCLRYCIVSQFVFAALISHSNPNAIIINLISAAIAQAGANQSGELAYDFKVGSIIGARPGAQAQGQIIGSLFGALISCGAYRLYSSQYPIPGPLFTVPSSYLVLSTARLLLGQGLPEGVAPFALGAAMLSMVATIVKIRYNSRRWQKFIPSGVSFAIGVVLSDYGHVWCDLLTLYQESTFCRLSASCVHSEGSSFGRIHDTRKGNKAI